jgi:hypothetical protein
MKIIKLSDELFDMFMLVQNNKESNLWGMLKNYDQLWNWDIFSEQLIIFYIKIFGVFASLLVWTMKLLTLFFYFKIFYLI